MCSLIIQVVVFLRRILMMPAKVVKTSVTTAYNGVLLETTYLDPQTSQSNFDPRFKPWTVTRILLYSPQPNLDPCLVVMPQHHSHLLLEYSSWKLTPPLLTLSYPVSIYQIHPALWSAPAKHDVNNSCCDRHSTNFLMIMIKLSLTWMKCLLVFHKDITIPLIFPLPLKKKEPAVMVLNQNYQIRA